jgi:hypothetical protein
VLLSDLLGVNPATLNEMVLYYRLMTKRTGLGDSTELSRVGLSQLPAGPSRVPYSRAYRGASVPRSDSVGPLVAKQAGRRLFKAAGPPSRAQPFLPPRVRRRPP